MLCKYILYLFKDRTENLLRFREEIFIGEQITTSLSRPSIFNDRINQGDLWICTTLSLQDLLHLTDSTVILIA